MKTSIHVSKLTVFILKKLKEETSSPSYDETIQKLIAVYKKPNDSWLGKAKYAREFKREEIWGKG